MPRPPLRLLIVVLVGWMAVRVFVLWPERQIALAQQVRRATKMVASLAPLPEVAPARLVTRRRYKTLLAVPIRRVTADVRLQQSEIAAPAASKPQPEIPLPSQEYSQKMPRAALNPPAMTTAPSRWSGWAYLYARAGGARSLASQGQIGGSQVAARIAYRGAGPVSAVARAYAPLKERGAEAAFGIDLALPANAHIVIERRVGLDRAGRDAWSAYASGGFYRKRGRLVADGYAQAGLVGARRRDAFVDGAMRVGRRIAIADVPLVAGIGAWGAAQPGAARLDAGPRVALQIPVARRTIALSLDGRFRIAGHARPGSGLALTLGADL